MDSRVRPDMVTVYYFRLLDGGYESTRVSGFMATREAIETIYRGDPIPGSARTVPAADLDDQGRYRRVATGWGELS